MLVGGSEGWEKMAPPGLCLPDQAHRYERNTNSRFYTDISRMLPSGPNVSYKAGASGGTDITVRRGLTSCMASANAPMKRLQPLWEPSGKSPENLEWIDLAEAVRLYEAWAEKMRDSNDHLKKLIMDLVTGMVIFPGTESLMRAEGLVRQDSLCDNGADRNIICDRSFQMRDHWEAALQKAIMRNRPRGVDEPILAEGRIRRLEDGVAPYAGASTVF